MKQTRLLVVVFVALVAELLAHGARATDGVKLLKQPKTFPIVISASGSYRLKSNITVPDANTTAISVQADNITIDLNGFTIQGPVVCSGEPVTGCSPSGSGIGIDGGGHTGLTVRNGVIRGMGDAGALLANASRFENVTADSNGGNGISSFGTPGPKATTAIGCIGNGNGGVGINAVSGSVHNSSASFNQGSGIIGDAVTGSTAEVNGSIGISGFSVVGSTANNNGLDGINSNGAVANSVAAGNGRRGITAGAASGCFADSNSGSPQILATGIAGHNICSGSPCP
jgi:hypothetical protein